MDVTITAQNIADKVAIDKLVTDNYKLVGFVTSRFNVNIRNGTVDEADIISAAYMGLWKAAKGHVDGTFDKQYSFSTYAVKIMLNDCIRVVNKQLVHNKKCVSLEQTVSGETEMSLMDTLPESDASTDTLFASAYIDDISEALKRVVDKSLTHFSDKSQLIARTYIQMCLDGNRPTYEDVAKKLGVTDGWVWDIVTRLRKYAKKEAERIGLI